MPSIIPALPVRPTTPNRTSTLSTTAPLTISSGEYLYAVDTVNVLINQSYTISNGGILWINNNLGSSLAIASTRALENSGLIIAESTNYIARGVFLDNSFTLGMNNLGSLYAISANNSALGFFTSNSASALNNSGLIAVQSGVNASAIGANFYNGGQLTNAQNGRIIVEGGNAIAIDMNAFYYRSSIINHGLIEAASTNINNESIALNINNATSNSDFSITNDGIIRADYSIYTSTDTSPLQVGRESVTNLAGGQIYGIIATFEGDDRLDNAGLIQGDVYLGDGNDFFDTSSGILRGVVDLGFGNDTFFGSSGNDVVLGGRDDDTIEGKAGNDLIVAGQGNDRIIGGVGNDSLYGEYGNDEIITQGGDFISAGSGDDKIILGDYTFEWLDGGAGFNTLVLPDDVRNLDWISVISSGRIQNINAVSLLGNHNFTLRGDLALSSLPNNFVIDSTSTDHITLSGAWIEGSGTIQSGQNFRSFSLGNNNVLISSASQIMVASAIPQNLSVLDSIAGGSLAPRIKSVLGSYTSSNITSVTGYLVTSSLTITQDEIWNYGIQTGIGNNILVSNIPVGVVFENYGIVYAFSENGGAPANARAISFYFVDKLNNYGEITAEGGVNASATAVSSEGLSLLNEGKIQAFASNYATALNTISEVINRGSISAVCQKYEAIGVYLGSGKLDNQGDIYASGNSSVGIYRYGNGNINNSGVIEAVSSVPTPPAQGPGPTVFLPVVRKESVGIWYSGTYANSTIVNSGIIRADVAIRQQVITGNFGGFYVINSGSIFGSIQTSYQNEGVSQGTYANILNTGVINGTISLGFGNDVYDASGSGTQNGAVYGGDGNDQIVGGITADQLYGDNGDDALKGGLGNDLLFGGYGYDTAYYDAASNAAGSAAFRTVAGVAVGRSAIEGSDILSGIEAVRFSDRTVTLNQFTNFAASDANGDGDSDIIFYSQSTGRISRMDYVGGASTAAALVGETFSGNWDIQVTGDFNRDGVTDVVLKDASNGRFYIWTLNASGVQSGGRDLGIIGTNWSVVSTGDYNSDGVADLLWRDSSNGHAYIWMLDANTGLKSSTSLGVLGTNWNVAQSGDFDGDGTSDVLLRNSTTGQAYIYYLHDGAYSHGGSVNVFGAAWNVAGVGDFNNDGRSDIMLKNGATGQFYLLAMNGTTAGDYSGSSLGTIGTAWNIVQTGDYNNDGTDDILWRNSGTGQVYMWAMQDGHQAASGSGNVGIFAADAMIV
jgi:RTX calcium-binding nonapeptide repeat (4 copies)/FG-GAP-like repeat